MGHSLWSAPDIKPAAGTPAGRCGRDRLDCQRYACDLFASRFDRHQSVTFSRIFRRYAAEVRGKEPIMIGLVRATVICATLALGLTAAGAADKAFKRDELADSAVKLEAQIKSEAGPVAKSSATLRGDADAEFKRSDFRVGLQILGQIAATSPEDSGNWLKLARTIFQIRSASSSEQTFLLERASTAAYIAYQRAGNQAEEADALAVLGRAMSDRKLWRPALDAFRLSLAIRQGGEGRGP